MNKSIIYLVLLFPLLCQNLLAQESFEKKAKQIGENIQKISEDEKKVLKAEVVRIDEELNAGKISQKTADSLKSLAAIKTSQQIERKVAEQEAKLLELVKMKVDDQVFEKTDTIRWKKNRIIVSYEKDDNKKDKTKKWKKGEKRTTSQFVFAMGLNNLLVNEDLSSLDQSDFSTWGSRFYEWGATYNTRIFKNNNFWHAKYGFSVMYNNLRPTENRYFVKDGNQTILVPFGEKLEESRLRNVQLVFPLHLELDFTPKKTHEDGTNYFRTHKSFRIGLGGYAGLRLKTKQKLEYTLNDQDVYVKELGDFNANTLIYGLSTYVSYKEVGLYVKYDLNPLFKNNPVRQNNISFGVRFDFN